MSRNRQTPLTWVSGNVIYARDMRDPWGVYVLGTESHECASDTERLRAFDALSAMLTELEADCQLLRVHRFWDPDRYETSVQELSSPHVRARAGYLREQVDEFEESSVPPMLVLSVSLRAPRSHVSELAGEALADPAGQFAGIRDRLRGAGLGATARSQRDVDADHDRAEEMLARIGSHLPKARAATVGEVEWLVRRAFCRGVGEPQVDGLDTGRALVFERNGASVLRPESVDLLRWTDPVALGYRDLRCESELGTSCQTVLVACSMPPDAPEGSRALELLFGPQDLLAHPIDIGICARFVTPTRAAKKVDGERARADEAAREEAMATRGASDRSLQRTEVARDAELYVTAGRPLHEVTFTVTVSAEDPQTLRGRVRETISTFRSYGVTLRVPVGQQLQGWMEQLPAQRSWTRGYVRRVTAEQLAAMAPRAAHRLGGAHGYVWGTVGPEGSSTVARWCPRDGSRLNTAPGVLIVGTAGSGKTTAAAKLTTEAFLDGAVVFDFTAKSADHFWHHAPLVAQHTDVVELDGRAHRGLLDPWLHAPDELRIAAATDFLATLLPRRMPTEWDTKLKQAVDRVARTAARPCNGEVLEALEQAGDPMSTAVAEHLRVQSRGGLAALGFASSQDRVRELGGQQVTHVQLENLPVPKRGVPRADYDEQERQGSALAKLVALLGLGILARHPADTKLFNFDEVKVLLDHDAGRRILDQLQRLGRSKLAVPVLQTQYASDVGLDRDSVGALFGTVMAFRAPSEDEAVRSLELLGRKPTNKLVRELVGASSGRALVRDHRGQVEWLSVQLPGSLRRRVETNPMARKVARV